MNSIKDHVKTTIKNLEDEILGEMEQMSEEGFVITEWGAYGYRELNKHWREYRLIITSLMPSRFDLDLEDFRWGVDKHDDFQDWLFSMEILSCDDIETLKALLFEQDRLDEKVRIWNEKWIPLENIEWKSWGRFTRPVTKWESNEEKATNYDKFVTEKLNEVTIPDLASIILGYL